MDRIHDPPPVNSARKVTHLFQEAPLSAVTTTRFEDFVPFSQERDHLGRLIRPRAGERCSRNPTSRSLKSLPLSNDGPAATSMDRIFRRTHLPA